MEVGAVQRGGRRREARVRVGEEEIPNFEGREGADVGAGASSRRYRRVSSEGIAWGEYCAAPSIDAS